MKDLKNMKYKEKSIKPKIYSKTLILFNKMNKNPSFPS
jgi:hypothetical protein